MNRSVAFLRAINVGGHTVKMDYLRALFEEMGLSGVETFIASGNVVFATPEEATGVLEQRIAAHLHAALGYRVATFVRSAAELEAIAAYRPFPDAELDADGAALHIGFLAERPDGAAQQRIVALQTPDDRLHVHDRELYWLRRGRFSDSVITGAALEKALGMPATVRNATTVRKLAAKYPQKVAL